MKKLDRQLAIQYYKSHLIRKIKRLTIRNPFFMFLRNVWLFRRELWNFRKFDYKYNLDLFCRSLEITRDFLASEDAIAEPAPQNAEEIEDFLEAIDNFHNHVEIGMEELGYDFSPLFGHGSEEEMEKDKALLDKIHKVEEDSWERAMDILKNRMRHWWD